MKLILNPKYIAVKEIEETITHSSGLIFTSTSKDIKKYQVVAAPDISVSTFNSLNAGDISVGNLVYINSSLVNEIELSGSKYYFANINDVLAIVTE